MCRPHRIFNEQDGVHRGELITHGPAHVSVLDASSGQLSLVAPQASIEVGPPSGDQHFRIAHGGAQLGGMLNLSQGADLRRPTGEMMGSAGGSRSGGGGGGGGRSPNNTTTLTLGTDGNFFRVRGTADIERVAVGPRGGTQVI
eukprot:COSAG01_NODE_20215_length_965_cov_1.180139_2_plen_143_part_00